LHQERIQSSQKLHQCKHNHVLFFKLSKIPAVPQVALFPNFQTLAGLVVRGLGICYFTNNC
jgi:hypothetical protein